MADIISFTQPPADPPPAGHQPDNAAIDSAVDAARADALLLECAFQSAIARQHEVWEMSKRGRIPGYHLFLLTTDQLDMLEHAVNRVFRSTTEAYEAIHGPDVR